MTYPGSGLPADVLAWFEGADTSGGVVPLAYYDSFLRYLRKHRDLIDIVTYRDFQWGDDRRFRWSYPGEAKAWMNRVRQAPRRERRIQVLIQHDVDSNPERTMAMLQLEAHYGVCSNVMVFNQHVARSPLAKSREIVELPYCLHDSYLRDLQQRGFVIGYHCNAYERALFDVAKAHRLFVDDIDALRRRFQIDFFSCHGGVRDESGLSNRDIKWPAEQRDVTLVHNPYGPVFSRTFTDGAFMSRSAESLDLAGHIKNWVPGLRYRILVHPQYFHPEPEFAQHLSATSWYGDAFATHCAKHLVGENADAGRKAAAEPFPSIRQRSLLEKMRLLITENLRVAVKLRRLAMLAALEKLRCWFGNTFK